MPHPDATSTLVAEIALYRQFLRRLKIRLMQEADYHVERCRPAVAARLMLLVREVAQILEG